MIFLTFLLLCPLLAGATGKRALLVGISNYRANGRTTWWNIHGANDVELLRPVFERQDFRVTTLCDEQATKQHIVAALQTLAREAAAGDIVYVHFSCHGQPVEDGVNGMALDEEDGFDESIVPIDAGRKYDEKGYRGEAHLTDDELNSYFQRIRKRLGERGMLYVVFDACHSGGAGRDAVGFVRGDRVALTKTRGKVYQPSTGDAYTHYAWQQQRGYAPILYLEACRANEMNSEIEVGNRYYGSLSYNVYKALTAQPMDKDSSKFERNVRQSAKTKGRWPTGNAQNIVTERTHKQP